MLLLGALLVAVVIGWVLFSPLILPHAPQPSAGGDAYLHSLAWSDRSGTRWTPA
jgi:hypothetical protein